MHSVYWSWVHTRGERDGTVVTISAHDIPGDLVDGYPAPSCPLCTGPEAHRLMPCTEAEYVALRDADEDEDADW